jgi:plasmid maintenance system killer protein
LQHESCRYWTTPATFGTCRARATDLEKLKGALSGKYSIRINDQFRIVFNFDRGEASNVVITDYH